MLNERQNDLSRTQNLNKASKASREQFYEFYKRIQNSNIYDYFKCLKKNLLIQIDKCFSPYELSQEFEKMCQASLSKVRAAKKAWTDEENHFLISLVVYYTIIKDEDFTAIV